MVERRFPLIFDAQLQTVSLKSLNLKLTRSPVRHIYHSTSLHPRCPHTFYGYCKSTSSASPSRCQRDSQIVIGHRRGPTQRQYPNRSRHFHQSQAETKNSACDTQNLGRKPKKRKRSKAIEQPAQEDDEDPVEAYVKELQRKIRGEESSGSQTQSRKTSRLVMLIDHAFGATGRRTFEEARSGRGRVSIGRSKVSYSGLTCSCSS